MQRDRVREEGGAASPGRGGRDRLARPPPFAFAFIFNAGEVTANGMLPVGTAAEKENGIFPGPPVLSNLNGRKDAIAQAAACIVLFLPPHVMCDFVSAGYGGLIARGGSNRAQTTAEKAAGENNVTREGATAGNVRACHLCNTRLAAGHHHNTRAESPAATQALPLHRLHLCHTRTLRTPPLAPATQQSPRYLIPCVFAPGTLPSSTSPHQKLPPPFLCRHAAALLLRV